MAYYHRNQHDKGERRTVRRLVKLTPSEDLRAQALAKIYGSPVVDVLRAGIDALEREHAEAEEEIPLVEKVARFLSLPPKSDDDE